MLAVRLSTTNVLAGLGAAILFISSPVAGFAKSLDCNAMTGRTIAASATNLPSRGVTINLATLEMVEGGTKRFCKILGQINPVDRSAPPVLFQVNLPEIWNGKYLQYGGGGLNGTLVTGLAGVRDAPPGPIPLALGYATAGTDAGHPNAKPAIQIFALNAEATANHAYAAYVKTSDVARFLIQQFYGTRPKLSYFIGGSEGGREALMFAQRYPRAFSGIVATVPVLNWTGIQLATYDQWIFARGDGWMSKSKVALWSETILARCDARDGIRDGVIADYGRCEADAALKRLECARDVETEQCFTTAQLALISVVRSPRRYKFPLANGETSYPQFPSGGETLPGSIVPVIVDAKKPSPEDPAYGRYAVGDVRYFFTKDPNFAAPFDETAYRDQVLAVSRLMDMTDPDLAAFRKAGGKLIIKSNGSDFVHSPAAVVRYYQQVVRKLGVKPTGSFVRLFVAPGVTHGGQGVKADGTPTPDRVDMLSAIDDWITRDQEPKDLVLTGYGKSGIAETSWPLCPFPQYPHYQAGDPRRSASYACAQVSSDTSKE